jgi:hypothetical protein
MLSEVKIDRIPTRNCELDSQNMGDICVVEQPETEIHLEEMTARSRSEDNATEKSTMLNNSTGESTINNSNSTTVMNMNGRILERNEPPYNILSTAGLINTDLGQYHNECISC